jgi:hypothetical protein
MGDYRNLCWKNLAKIHRVKIQRPDTGCSCCRAFYLSKDKGETSWAIQIWSCVNSFHSGLARTNQLFGLRNTLSSLERSKPSNYS